MVYGILIILLAVFIPPMSVKAANEDYYPEEPFDSFEEWETYYFENRRPGIYWDSWLYCPKRKIDEDGNLIWWAKPGYPFKDVDTWKDWWDTCLEKQASGEYFYEYVNENNYRYWSRKNRTRTPEQLDDNVVIEPMEGLEETPRWKISLQIGWHEFLHYLGIK